MLSILTSEVYGVNAVFSFKMSSISEAVELFSKTRRRRIKGDLNKIRKSRAFSDRKPPQKGQLIKIRLSPRKLMRMPSRGKRCGLLVAIGNTMAKRYAQWVSAREGASLGRRQVYDANTIAK
jgi:hypothetical protein